MKRTVKKASERRGEIISAARKLFQTKGYEKVTMQELMDRLNIAKGTFYQYFCSKDELLEAVVTDLVDKELRKKEDGMKSFKGGHLNALATMQLLSSVDTMSEDHDHILDMLHFLTDVGFNPWNEGQLVQRGEAFPALVEALLDAPKVSFSFLAE